MVLRLLVLLLLAALVMVGCDSGQEEEEVSIFTIADDSTVSKTGKTGVEVTKPSPASETGEGGTTTTFFFVYVFGSLKKERVVWRSQPLASLQIPPPPHPLKHFDPFGSKDLPKTLENHLGTQSLS